MFDGEEFIEAYLRPRERGCPRDHPPDCLCDVDVSKTAGITWDRCPPQLINVETVEELVHAAANIWLEYDLLGAPTLVQKLEWVDDPEMVENVKRMVSEGRSMNAVENELHISLDGRTFAMIRRAVGYQPPPRINYDLLHKFHGEGLSLMEIKRRFRETTGESFHHSTISKALYRQGLKPNGPVRKGANPGRPKGYDPNCGFGYRRWRELYGET